MSGFYGITFGALCAIPYFFMGGFPSAFAYWVSGIVYDIPHCIGNVLICLLLFKPLYKVLNQALNTQLQLNR